MNEPVKAESSLLPAQPDVSHAPSLPGRPGRVMCYVRPWNKEQFTRLAQELFPDAELDFCSEHRKIDGVQLVRRYYQHLKRMPCATEFCCEELDADDVIARCRLLRALPRKTAIRHLHAMTHALEQVMDDVRPEVVLSVTTDSYIIDVLRWLCGRKGVSFVGMVPSFVNGCFRVTRRGEVTLSPGPPAVAPEQLRETLLQPQYTPDFARAAVTRAARGVRQRWLGNLARVPYFAARRVFSRDPYNHHSWASQLIATEQATVLPPRDLGDREWNCASTGQEKPRLYIPLQMFPECTVDYWVNDVRQIDYYGTLERIIKMHHQALHILVKEHPAIMGYRPRGFYRQLEKDPRVTVIPTYTPSNEVLESVDAVLVWTGTVGFEAALRGKPVFTLARPYYASGQRFSAISPETPSVALLEHIVRCNERPVGPAEQEAMVAFLSGQLFGGRFRNDGSWNPEDAMDISDIEAMAKSLRALVRD